MISAGLLALIVGASVSALKPTGLIGTAAEGVLGNQADAAFLLACKCLIKALPQQASEPIREDLRRSLWLSYLRALVSISSVCKAELVGNFPRAYRGQPVYDETVKADIRWLDGNLEQLRQEIKAANGKHARLPDISLEALEGFTLAGESPASAMQLAAQAVMDMVIASDAIPLYVTKLQQPEEGVLDKTFNFFIEQLDENSKLHTFFETQLLMQIHGSLAEQKITLQEIDSNLKKVSQEVSQAVPQQFEQVIGKLEAIEADERPNVAIGLLKDVRALLIGTQRGSVERTDTVSFAVNDANPFIPVGGRIDSPDQFFGQEQTLKWIFETLNSGSSVALIGDREIGKSSLLKAVATRAEELLAVPREPVYLDLRNVADEEDFYYALCDNAGIPICKGYKLRRELESKRLLLMLDEIEKMTWDGFTNQVRGQLRSLAEGQDASLRLVIAASKPLDKLFIDSTGGNMTSPLSGICQEKPLSAWSDSIIREFVAARLQPTSISLSEEHILKIIQASRGKPREVMRLCNECYATFQGQPL